MRRRARAPRRGRKGARRSRIPRTLRPQMKVYTFNFRPTSQVLSSNLGGSIKTMTTANGGTAGPFPILQAGITNPISSSAGILNTIDWGAACTFCLQDCASYASYAGIFDAYKINKVTVELEYLNNVSGVAATGTLPTFYTYWDPDDATPPPSERNMLGKTGSMRWQPTASKLRKRFSFKPVLANTVAGSVGGGPVSGVVPFKSSQWIDCTQVALPHYAFKMFVTDFYCPTTVPNLVRIHYTYNISFRAPQAAS